MKRHDALTLITVIMLIIGIIVSAFTLWFVITNRNALSVEVQSLRQELSKYKYPQNVNDVSFDDAKLYIMVAKYCEVRNDCRGFNGQSIQGGIGPQGLQGIQGAQGEAGFVGPQGERGLQGETGATGATGAQGDRGADGRQIERRCNAEKNRIEWRYEGDEQWRVEYKLAPGQSCETEE